MSTDTFPVATETEELADLVEGFVTTEDLPATDWLAHRHLVAPLPTLRAPGRGRLRVKRVFDILAASLLLLLTAPVMVLAAILVRTTSRGPALFRQTRIGLNSRWQRMDRRTSREGDLPPSGMPERRERRSDRRRWQNAGKPFTLYKFRTMYLDAEKDGARLAVENDPRITAVGRWLRKARIDELPQLWNVLRGEMSLVGPRPERPEFIEELAAHIPDYLHRLRLRPGLTGLAQIINGYDNHLESFRRKVTLDLLYLQNCSLWNDIKICLRTIAVVLTGKGAL